MKKYRMNFHNLSIKYSFPAQLAYFIASLPLFNLVALFQSNQPSFFFVAQAFAFVYILLAPGLFLLSLLTHKKFPFALGITFAVALSIFSLMILGLVVNTVLPWIGMTAPLTTIPLLITFDIFVVILFSLNAVYKKEFVLETPKLGKKGCLIVGIALLLPILACIGAISLNNDGTNLFNMIALAVIFLVVPFAVFIHKKVDDSLFPILLYIIALTFLLLNTMRGWFVTGHDILLEHHVFTLTNSMHLWSMAAFRDPYNACLSLTILPTFIQNLLHVSETYVFKFLFQFIGAFPVVAIYYLCKKYTSGIVAFLAGFLFISFPSFMVDMAFLNRQGLAFLFFIAIIFTLLNREYFGPKARVALLFIFGTGMIISHYSTSYVAIALFIGTYIVNKIIRLVMTKENPKWLSKLTGTVSNKEVYSQPILLKAYFVLGLLGIMLIWSVVITKTSTGLFKTLREIGTNLSRPFGIDDYSGPAKYSIVNSKQVSPEELFEQYVKETVKKSRTPANAENLYPQQLAKEYISFPVFPVNEPLIPITPLGNKIEEFTPLNLMNFYNLIKQLYAKIMQVFLFIGFVGIAIGYSFKKNLLSKVPSEFIALSITGIGLMVAQTLLPASAIDYGLLRLFQQNLIFLTLPISLGISAVVSIVSRNNQLRLLLHSAIILLFYLVLSGFLPQITGGGRPALPLNTYGFYYDTYYTHAQEIASIEWLKRSFDPKFIIQSDHYFSNIKILTYANMSTNTGLLSQTIKKDSYVYLNHNNVKSSNVIEFINGDVFYYHFPIDFLGDHKNLIYNNGGSQIYK